jgi:hypothetical protein
MGQSDAMKDAAYFKLAPDAETRVIDCGQFSRTNTGAPFCACLKHPYCCGVDSGPDKCSFRIPKTQKPYIPKQRPSTQGHGRAGPTIAGFMTLREFAARSGITLTAAKKLVQRKRAILQGHISKHSGLLYIDEWAATRILTR